VLACDARVAQNVGAVVLAANAHLHNGDVHALAPEDVEGEDGHELEVGRPVVRGPALAHLYAGASYKFTSNNSYQHNYVRYPVLRIRCLFDPWIRDG
jgi:hypothetical protein